MGEFDLAAALRILAMHVREGNEHGVAVWTTYISEHVDGLKAAIETMANTAHECAGSMYAAHYLSKLEGTEQMRTAMAKQVIRADEMRERLLTSFEVGATALNRAATPAPGKEE